MGMFTESTKDSTFCRESKIGNVHNMYIYNQRLNRDYIHVEISWD